MLQTYDFVIWERRSYWIVVTVVGFLDGGPCNIVLYENGNDIGSERVSQI